MNYGDIPLFHAMRHKMQYLSERQAVLASNIANVDTPGYKARDVVRPDFASELKSASSGVGMAITNAMHLGKGAAGNTGMFKTIERASTFETNPDGNTVAADEEVQKMSMNQSEYQQVVLLYRKSIDMFKTALGRGNG